MPTLLTVGSLIHLWIIPFMRRLHPAGGVYPEPGRRTQHERTAKAARLERSEDVPVPKNGEVVVEQNRG